MSQSRQTASLDTPYPLANFFTCANFSTTHRAFWWLSPQGMSPSLFRKQPKILISKKLCKKEVEALEENGTWSLVPFPNGKKLIRCKRVYKIKYHSDGTTERYKARLVIQDNEQEVGVDFTETFTPVAKIVSIHTFLIVVV